jgi:hypothetical protein
LEAVPVMRKETASAAAVSPVREIVNVPVSVPGSAAEGSEATMLTTGSAGTLVRSSTRTLS